MSGIGSDDQGVEFIDGRPESSAGHHARLARQAAERLARENTELRDRLAEVCRDIVVQRVLLDDLRIWIGKNTVRLLKPASEGEFHVVDTHRLLEKLSGYEGGR